MCFLMPILLLWLLGRRLDWRNTANEGNISKYNRSHFPLSLHCLRKRRYTADLAAPRVRMQGRFFLANTNNKKVAKQERFLIFIRCRCNWESCEIIEKLEKIPPKQWRRRLVRVWLGGTLLKWNERVHYNSWGMIWLEFSLAVVMMGKPVVQMGWIFMEVIGCCSTIISEAKETPLPREYMPSFCSTQYPTRTINERRLLDCVCTSWSSGGKGRNETRSSFLLHLLHDTTEMVRLEQKEGDLMGGSRVVVQAQGNHTNSSAHSLTSKSNTWIFGNPTKSQISGECTRWASSTQVGIFCRQEEERNSRRKWTHHCVRSTSRIIFTENFFIPMQRPRFLFRFLLSCNSQTKIRTPHLHHFYSGFLALGESINQIGL